MTDEELQLWYEKAVNFHKKQVPGLFIAIVMTDLCRTRLGNVKDCLNIVCESVSCLTDVIQLMTGCTVGNRYLTIHANLGRFALTMFDRADGRGVRAYIDLDKIIAADTPELHRFFYRTRSAEVKAGGPARLESGKQIIKEFMTVREQIIGLQEVQLEKFGKPLKPGAARCPVCRESFLQINGEEKCSVCRGDFRYYQIKN